MSLESFTKSYIETLIWQAPEGDDGTNLDEFDSTDIDNMSMPIIEQDCRDFYGAYNHLWQDEDGYTDEVAGHDFILTRNGHGAGFWDRGLKNGDILSNHSRPYGTQDIYLGDDGRLHV